MTQRYTPDDQLKKGRRSLMDGYLQRFKIEFEENSRYTSVMFQYPRIMCHTVLVRVEWFGSWCDIGGWYHM